MQFCRLWGGDKLIYGGSNGDLIISVLKSHKGAVRADLKGLPVGHSDVAINASLAFRFRKCELDALDNVVTELVVDRKPEPAPEPEPELLEVGVVLSRDPATAGSWAASSQNPEPFPKHVNSWLDGESSDSSRFKVAVDACLPTLSRSSCLSEWADVIGMLPFWTMTLGGK